MTKEWKLPVDKNGKPTGNIITPMFRASFVALFEPKGIKGQPESKKRYSVVMLFPKDTDFEPLKKLIMQVATEKWADKAEGILRKQSNSDKRIFKDQGEMADRFDGFEDGCIYLNAGNEKKPGLVGRKAGPDGTLIEITDEDVFESGDYAIASLRPFAWEHPVGGKGVSLSLNNVQMIKKGDRLGGGRTKPSDDFEAYDDDDLDQASAPAPKAAAGKDPFA